MPNNTLSKSLMLSVCCLGLAVLVGCGASPPSQTHYDVRAIEQAPVQSKNRAALRHLAKLVLASRRIKLREDGRTKTLKPADVNALSLAVLQGIRILDSGARLGAEVDALIPIKGRGAVPVTLVTDMNGDATIVAARAPKRPQAKPAYIPRFLNGDEKWSAKARETLKLAMGLVSKQEAAALKDLALVRYRKSKDKRKGAVYLQKGCEAEIRIYNRSFSIDRFQFVGEPSRPLPASARTVLHEVGHAIHNRPGRLAYCSFVSDQNAFKKRIDRYNSDLKRAKKTRDRRLAARLQNESAALARVKKKLQKRADKIRTLIDKGPVLMAFASAIGSEEGPTEYAMVSIKEAFAEAYSLYRSDPAALSRVMPKAFRWFNAGGHIKAMNQKPSA